MKKILLVISILFLSLFSLPVMANDTKVVDEYGALSDSEREELENDVETLIEKVGFDIVIYFADSQNDDITALADDYFDYNDYGLGSDRDGIILCINYTLRDYTITTRGYDTITLFADDALDNELYANITPYLSDGDSVGAAKAFLSGVEYVYDHPDKYIHEYHEPEEEVNPIKTALISGGIGSLIISLIVFLVLRGQLKTQGIKKQANAYMTNSGVDIFRSGEIFLYKTSQTTKIERSDNSSSGGGSSTHISSSGATHGGGGSHKF